MKTFAINTLGCKVNQYESQQIRELLERLGLNHVKTADKADLVVINTCCVTHTASAKSRQQIRKSKRQSPDAAIVISGCLPTVQIGELKNVGNNIHLISHRNRLAATLCQIINGKAESPKFQSLQAKQNIIIKAEGKGKIKHKSKPAEQPQLTQLTSFKGHTRAFLKVQDGCDGYCSYCIIPKARPYVHSKPAETVLQEARALVKAGHKEIVVTGIFLGAYGQESAIRKKWADEQHNKLADLLDKMSEISGLARIRVSSLEPGDVTPRLLDVFCKHRNIMPHLHLSLQSGSNAILKKMRRQYSVEEFREKVDLIKSRLDRPAITTDVIVGYPGETDADFEATVELAKEAGFAKMHIFSFSPRLGTAATAMQGA
ncbi:MAG: tRNA (N(6)-L-threonylcarbamoyladenosine(37)-C(2))-methylthiotransferase MtaB, partial [Sedimentisphaerales bacterium]